MIVVNHEIAFAREAADSVVFMDGGNIVEMGGPNRSSVPSASRHNGVLGPVPRAVVGPIRH